MAADESGRSVPGRLAGALSGWPVSGHAGRAPCGRAVCGQAEPVSQDPGPWG
jgi:hypothetical protein